MDLQAYKGVMVFAEQRDGALQSVALELVGEAKRLADVLKEPVIAVLLGHKIEHLTDDLTSHGADVVVVVDAPELIHYDTEAYSQAMDAIIRDKKPNILLVGATTLGRDLAPRLSGRVHTGLTADCTELTIDNESGELWMTRPTFGGNLMATIVCPEHRPQMATVRPGVMAKQPKANNPAAKVESFKVTFNPEKFKVRFKKMVPEAVKRIDITEAKVLISGGRGVGAAGIPALEALAKALNGEISASRALVDAGILPHERMVGQTGKTVRPDLYIAAGISGAIQHVAGMENSELMIAINKDKSAPIFNVADLGIVGDFHEIAPLLVKALEKK